MHIHQMLATTAARLPDKTALVEDDRALSYAEVAEQVERLAGGLQARGVTRGDRVAMLFPNCLEFVLSYYATLSLAAIAVPLNNRLAAGELAYILNDSGAKRLLLGPGFGEMFLAFRDELETVQQVFLAGEETIPGVKPWGNLLHAPGASSVEVDPGDPACIMYTSGTTGLPKGAVMSHRNIMANARNCGAHLHYRESDVTLIAVPLFHVTGLNSQLVAFGYTGGCCVLMRRYGTAEMIRLVEQHRVSVLFNVPTMYTLMLLSDELTQRDLSSLRTAVYGGAPMPPETARALQSRLGVDLYNAYGLTETSSLATVLPSCDAVRKGASVGLPVSGVRLSVVDEHDNEVEAGSVGELVIEGANVVSRYWNKTQATKAAIADGRLRTGDYARIDAEGFVYIVDRKKDMINRGGENIYSIEVESVLVTHPQVLEAAVVPRAHSIFGEVVHAFIVPRPGGEVTEEEVIEHCRGRIADFRMPCSISLIENLPRNPGGKVLKNRLRELVPEGDPPRREPDTTRTRS